MKARDLSKAITLRPAEVFQLYGIPTSTLCRMCKNPNEEERLPSIFIKGRGGRMGIRLINHEDLRAYFARHKTT